MKLQNLSDEEYFKTFVTTVISKDFVLLLDSLITTTRLTYTKKQALARFRDDGTMDSIILGKFDKVLLSEVIEILAIFNLGLRFIPVNKEDYCEQDIMSIH